MKRVITLALVSALAATGCGGEMDQTNETRDGQWNPMMMRSQNTTEGYNVINRESADHDQYLEFGFVRNSKANAQEEKYPGYAVYDRELLANSISEMAAVIPSVEDCGVLVTSDQVLMVYEAQDTNNLDRNDVADQVKKTALSVVPSYYEVYVSDDMTMMDEIERFGGLSPESDEYEDSLEQTIEQFKQYPQGESISEDELHYNDNDDMS